MSTRFIWISILLICIASVSTFIMIESQLNKPAIPKAVLMQSPDTFMNHVNYTRYTTDGLIQSQLSSSKVIHFPKENAASFTKPHLLVYTSERIPWIITADHGKSRHGTDWTFLWGNVILHQLPQPNNPETTIKTAALMYYPPKSYAETDKKVTITRPNSYTEGIGMTADFNKEIFTLLSHSRGMYVPEKSTHSIIPNPA